MPPVEGGERGRHLAEVHGDRLAGREVGAVQLAALDVHPDQAASSGTQYGPSPSTAVTSPTGSATAAVRTPVTGFPFLRLGPCADINVRLPSRGPFHARRPASAAGDSRAAARALPSPAVCLPVSNQTLRLLTMDDEESLAGPGGSGRSCLVFLTRVIVMRRCSALAAGPLDVLVIGGGITGAGAALDAASRGLRVGLVESRDLAAGTRPVAQAHPRRAALPGAGRLQARQGGAARA